jgi:excisionase family DNA binding protein
MTDCELVAAVADEVFRRLEPLLTRATASEPEYLTLAEVKARTGFSYDYIYDAVRSADLPATKKGREWRVAVADVRAWMARDRVDRRVPVRAELRRKVSRLMPALAG